MRGITVAIKSQGNSITLPSVCPCCMGYADASDKITYEWNEGGRRGKLKLSVPMCRACLIHRTKSDEMGCGLAVVGLIGFVILFVGGLSRSAFGVVGLLLLLATALIHWLGRDSRAAEAAKIRQPNCTSLRVIRLERTLYGKYSGTALLTVGNAIYASLLAERNKTAKILADSELEEFGLAKREEI